MQKTLRHPSHIVRSLKMCSDAFFSEATMKKSLTYFTKSELILWLSSISVIIVIFLLFDRTSYLTLTASLIGVSSLIFCAKGNPAGQVLMIIFSLIYGIISYGFAYYGEMITYLGMTLPMSVISLVSWLKNPYKGNKAVVAINRIGKKEVPFMLLLTLAVTVTFFFILQHFGTANLLPSTLSVTTSFTAAYLTFRRSPYFALCYALNDIVLIFLWILATMEDISYLSVIICFAVFLINDLYGFFNWKRMESSQECNI